MNFSTAEPTGLDVRRLAAGLWLIAALAASGQAVAQTTGSVPTGHCSHLGEGFVPVAGSDTCVRIGGHVRVDGGPIGSEGPRGGMRPASEHSYVRAPSSWTGLYPR